MEQNNEALCQRSPLFEHPEPKPLMELEHRDIIFSILATLFFVGSVLIYNDNDTSRFLDDLTYSEGTVKQVNQGVDNNGKIIAYSVVLEENIVLTVDGV